MSRGRMSRPELCVWMLAIGAALMFALVNANNWLPPCEYGLTTNCYLVAIP